MGRHHYAFGFLCVDCFKKVQSQMHTTPNGCLVGGTTAADARAFTIQAATRLAYNGDVALKLYCNNYTR